jgi:hypothetical protein
MHFTFPRRPSATILLPTGFMQARLMPSSTSSNGVPRSSSPMAMRCSSLGRSSAPGSGRPSTAACSPGGQAIDADANAIVAGSAIFGSPDYAAAIAAIRAGRLSLS